MHDDTLILGDFGLSKQLRDQGLANVGTKVNMYMAPEMEIAYKSQEVNDSLVDLWSVGVGYYRLIYGIFPFPNSNTMVEDIKNFSGSN